MGEIRSLEGVNMTRWTIKRIVDAAILGALGILPAVALADDEASPNGPPAASTETVPDHAWAESRAGAATIVPTAEKTEPAPDHAQAEARGRAAAAVPEAEQRPGAPDHATAESRGAVPSP